MFQATHVSREESAHSSAGTDARRTRREIWKSFCGKASSACGGDLVTGKAILRDYILARSI